MKHGTSGPTCPGRLSHTGQHREPYQTDQDNRDNVRSRAYRMQEGVCNAFTPLYRKRSSQVGRLSRHTLATYLRLAAVAAARLADRLAPPPPTPAPPPGEQNTTEPTRLEDGPLTIEARRYAAEMQLRRVLHSALHSRPERLRAGNARTGCPALGSTAWRCRSRPPDRGQRPPDPASGANPGPPL